MARSARAISVTPRRKAGYTLVELVIVIIFLGILAAFGSSLFVENFRAARYANRDNALDAEARYVMERIAREIREVGYDSSNNLSAYYCISSGLAGTQSSIVFSRSDGSLNALSNCAPSVPVAINATGSDLAFTSSGTTSFLTRQLGGFNLNFYKGDGTQTNLNTATVRFVDINLTLTAGPDGPTSIERTRVTLRNR